MKILTDLINSLPVTPVPVNKVIIGLHWTLVCSLHAGMASTITSSGPHGHDRLKDVGFLHHKSAQELAQWSMSDNLLEASIGVAAINSLVDVDETQIEQINAADVISPECQGKNLVVIGHFPFVDQMKVVAKNCWVIEKRPFADDFPESAAQEFVPQADVVAITGTALINHTLESLLSLTRPDSLVIVLGPSTPLSPLLFAHGIHLISGTQVIDHDAAAITIQQGAIMPQVKGVRLVTMVKPKNLSGR